MTADKYSPNHGVGPKEHQGNCQVLDLPLISCFKDEVWVGVVCLMVTAVLGAIVEFVVSAFVAEPVTIAAVLFVVFAVAVVDMLVNVGFNAAVVLVDTAAVDVDVVVLAERLSVAVEDDADFEVVAGDDAGVDNVVEESDAAAASADDDDDGVEDTSCIVVVVAVVFDDDDDDNDEVVSGDEAIPVDQEDENGDDDDDNDCDNEEEKEETDAVSEEACNDDVYKFDNDDIIECNDEGDIVEDVVLDILRSTQRRRIVINTVPYDIGIISVESKIKKYGALEKENLLHFLISIHMVAVNLK